MVDVGYPKGMFIHTVPIAQDGIRNSRGDKVVVVNKLTTYWVKPAFGTGRIRITVPIQYYLTSWDVKALERELERLGVKIKPKPVTKPGPKPGPVVAG